MSESKQNSLGIILPALEVTYKSLDIRAALGKSKKDKLWYCVILKAHLTHEDLNEVRKQQNGRKICHIDNNHFKLVFDCRQANQIDTFLTEIEQGQINIGGISARLLGYKDDYETIRNKELTNASSYTVYNEKSAYLHKLASTGMTSSPITMIHELGITKDEMGIRVEEISYCLNMSSISNPINIIILLPIYCRRLPLLSEERGRYLAKYQIHKSLVNDVKARVRVSPNGETATFKLIEDFDRFNSIQSDNEMIIGTLPMIPKIEYNDHIEIEIFHKSIHGIKIEDNFWANEVFEEENVIERIDPNLEKLESWLQGNKRGNDPHDFEKAVAILLSLCGLRTVHVGDVYESVTVTSRREYHKKTSVSIDILVLPSEEDNNIFVLQCTTDSKPEKVDEILDISNELKQGIRGSGILIQPVLITQVEAYKISSSKESAEANGVKVITIDNLRVLLNKILKNEKPHQIVLSFLT